MISNHKLGNQAGYTLLELLVTVALGGIILATLTTSFISQSKSYNAQNQVIEMQQSARTVMDFMIREIRMAGYNPTDNGFNGIAVCNATTLQVLADLDQDGLTTGTDEDITYSFSNSQILRNGVTLAENIASFDFDCSQGTSYQFTDKDSQVLTGEFTKAISASEINVKQAIAVPGATPPAGCTPDCYAYDPNGASDPTSVDPATLGYVGGLDSSVYGSGTLLASLVSQGTPGNGSKVKITLTARTAGIDPNYPTNGGYRTYILTSVITPRNLAL